ncbi:MAG: ice-binding family protein [Candidatus Eisenbacteria bacterium]
MFKVRRPLAQLAMMLTLAALLAVTISCHHPTKPCVIAGPGVGNGPVVLPTLLGGAQSFVILAGSTVTNTGATTTIVGNVGVSPGSAIIGIPSGQPTGGTVHAGNATASNAQAGLTLAYNDLTGRACNATIANSQLGGVTFYTGVYCWSGSAQLTGAVTCDAQGDPNAVFVFKIGSTLTTASAASVVLTGGALARNVYWVVGSSATIGIGTAMRGNILAQASITLTTGVNLSGRALARVAAVTLDSDAVALP